MSATPADGASTRGPVLLVRAVGGDDRDAEALRALGVDVIEDPYLVVAPSTDEAVAGRAARVLEALRDDVDLLLLTSRAAVRALDVLVGRRALMAAVAAGVARGMRGAAVGPSTAEALRELGVVDVLEPEVATSRGLLRELRERAAQEVGSVSPGHALLPCGAQAMKGLGAGLVEDGWQVEEVVVYVTDEVPGVPESVADLAAGRIAALVLRSPTAVRAVARHVPVLPAGTVPVCGGVTTAGVVSATWDVEHVISEGPTADQVARTVVRVLDGADVAGGPAADGAAGDGAGPREELDDDDV
jgi:uroporphyrinogen-III synthase